MSNIVGKLRWYPGDALTALRQQDLNKIAQSCNVNITLNEVKGTVFVTEGQTVYEETKNGSLEDITQTVVTITADSEQSFRQGVRQMIDKYRAPRTPYSNWGSDERAKEIIVELADQYDGWY